MDYADQLQEILAQLRDAQDTIPDAEGSGLCYAKMDRVADGILGVIRQMRGIDPPKRRSE